MKENANNRPFWEIDVYKLLFALLHKWWLILLCTLLGASAAWLYTFYYVTPMYQAKVSIFVNNTIDENVNANSLDVSQRLIPAYVLISKSDRVLEQVAPVLGNYTPDALRGMLSTQRVESTGVFQIVITHSDPLEAARVVNTMAEIVPDAIADIIVGSSAHVLDYATVPTSPFSPNYPRNVAIGAAIGFAFACLYIAVVFLLDTRIKEPNDLSELIELPILGQIPDFSRSSGSSRRGYAQAYEHKTQDEKDSKGEGTQ